MFGSSRNTILATGLACILALGTMGCSVSSESKTTTEVSTTDEDGTTTTTTTETTSSTSSDEGTSSETTTETTTVIDMSEWTDAWMGDSDKGFKVFYAQSPTDSAEAQALIAVYKPETKEIVKCLGTFTVPKEGWLLVEDAGNSDTFQFGISDETSAGAKLDLGDEFGIADVKPTPFDEFIQELRAVDVNHTVISE